MRSVAAVGRHNVADSMGSNGMANRRQTTFRALPMTIGAQFPALCFTCPIRRAQGHESAGLPFMVEVLNGSRKSHTQLDDHWLIVVEAMRYARSMPMRPPVRDQRLAICSSRPNARPILLCSGIRSDYGIGEVDG